MMDVVCKYIVENLKLVDYNVSIVVLFGFGKVFFCRSGN